MSEYQEFTGKSVEEAIKAAYEDMYKDNKMIREKRELTADVKAKVTAVLDEFKGVFAQ